MLDLMHSLHDRWLGCLIHYHSDLPLHDTVWTALGLGLTGADVMLVYCSRIEALKKLSGREYFDSLVGFYTLQIRVA